jgi:hypothetical protein
MRSKTMTIMAAAVLFLPTIVHAQPSEGRGIYQRDDLKNVRDDVRANSKLAPRHSGYRGEDGVRDSSSSSSSNAAPLPAVKVNAPGDSWTFAVLTIWQFNGKPTSPYFGQSGFIVRSSVKREPYGVFTSQDDCDIARAKKIVELDAGGYRLPHLTANAPVITTTITVGVTSITSNEPGGPTETMYVTDCATDAKKISAGSQTAQKN